MTLKVISGFFVRMQMTLKLNGSAYITQVLFLHMSWAIIKCENANDSKIEWICLYYPSIIFAHELSYHQINVNIVSRVANAGKEAYLGGKKSVRNMDFEWSKYLQILAIWFGILQTDFFGLKDGWPCHSTNIICCSLYQNVNLIHFI